MDESITRAAGAVHGQAGLREGDLQRHDHAARAASRAGVATLDEARSLGISAVGRAGDATGTSRNGQTGKRRCSQSPLDRRCAEPVDSFRILDNRTIGNN